MAVSQGGDASLWVGIVPGGDPFQQGSRCRRSAKNHGHLRPGDQDALGHQLLPVSVVEPLQVRRVHDDRRVEETVQGVRSNHDLEVLLGDLGHPQVFIVGVRLGRASDDKSASLEVPAVNKTAGGVFRTNALRAQSHLGKGTSHLDQVGCREVHQ